MVPLYPLDQIRSLQQLDDPVVGAPEMTTLSPLAKIRAIAQKRGWPFLYRGHSSTQLALGASNFLYFGFYNGLKSLVHRVQPQPLSSLTTLTISSLSGAFREKYSVDP